jgi:hypothetical protein
MKLHQRGAAAVEFALVLPVLLFLLLGFMELGRLLYTWNSAVEATRVGARTAAIVHPTDAAREALRAMNILMGGQLEDANVSVVHLPAGCAQTEPFSCSFVRVELAYTYHPVVWIFAPGLDFLPASITAPTFATTMPVEALGAF